MGRSGGDGRAGGFDDAIAVGEKGVLEGDARVQVLADEEVAVVESARAQADEEFAGPGSGLGDGV